MQPYFTNAYLHCSPLIWTSQNQTGMRLQILTKVRNPNPDKPEKPKHKILNSKQIQNSYSQKGIGVARIHWTSEEHLLYPDHLWLCFSHLDFEDEYWEFVSDFEFVCHIHNLLWISRR